MNKIYRSKTDRMIAGICGGLAEYFNIDSTIIRIVTLFLFFSSKFSFLVFYLIAAMIIPEDDGIIYEERYEDEGESGYRTQTNSNKNTSLFMGISLILFGSILLLKRFYPQFNFNIFRQLRLLLGRISHLWPILLILLGIYILFTRHDE